LEISLKDTKKPDKVSQTSNLFTTSSEHTLDRSVLIRFFFFRAEKRAILTLRLLDKLGSKPKEPHLFYTAVVPEVVSFCVFPPSSLVSIVTRR